MAVSFQSYPDGRIFIATFCAPLNLAADFRAARLVVSDFATRANGQFSFIVNLPQGDGLPFDEVLVRLDILRYIANAPQMNAIIVGSDELLDYTLDAAEQNVKLFTTLDDALASLRSESAPSERLQAPIAPRTGTKSFRIAFPFRFPPLRFSTLRSLFSI